MVIKAKNWMKPDKVEIKKVISVRRHPDYDRFGTKFPDLVLFTIDGKMENFNNKDEVQLAWFNPQDQSGDNVFLPKLNQSLFCNGTRILIMKLYIK